MKTQIKLDRAVAKLAKVIVRNAFGDLIGCPKGAEVIGGREGRTLPGTLRATEVLAWRRGKPQKRVVYITTKAITALSAEVAANSKAERATDAIAALRADAIAAGLTIAAYRRTLREKAAAAVIAAKEADAANEADDLRQWEDAVRDVCAKRDFVWGESISLYKVLEKLKAREGVAKAWLRGEFDGDREDFVCCVLGAADRHENTNYDELLSSGMDRDEARQFRERC